jgi:methyltransferase
MSPQFAVSAIAVVAVLLMMLAEMQLSRFNERSLRARGAVEPPRDVYKTMAWVYPASFVAMAVEGAVAGPAPGVVTMVGAALLGASKALKFWAISSLGTRWTFRVLVPPDAPRVTSGPYRFLNHPNYVAVLGELLSVAVLVGARVSGPIAVVSFALLIARRIRVEEDALRHPPCT